MNEYHNWQLIEEGHIATLTLNRPKTMNSLTTDTLNELSEITAYLSTRKGIWAVILQGQGDHFSSGADPNLITGMADASMQTLRRILRKHQHCLNEFEALEKPTIAKLRGFCIGGGLLLALCCDFRFASTRTIFSLPEIRLGIPIFWGAQRIAHLAGEAAAKEMVLLGGRFKAKSALDYGIVNKVVSPDELDSTVEVFARKFLRLPPRTVGIAKMIINQSRELSTRDSQELEIDCLPEVFSTHDFQEAMECYLDKRSPHFTGK